MEREKGAPKMAAWMYWVVVSCVEEVKGGGGLVVLYIAARTGRARRCS